ncbi:hypothetical protein Pyrde_0810 [Pyrodictium delaneyi]|uniref:Uncharacterized protein n=1 Tax=Pyrodictium delaneyi TaxID=1273541 RepID=A0A0P0N3B6_9CREN|nr:hypothetical protein [Pyrodictium delaneyi]ALL00860.1 hypothetical protein Pyrde_0810 [Pyrodictium delaneyi]OWJ55514.1 hypothetical protein Pdsh_01595 [Pyrodictium delaneyi]
MAKTGLALLGIVALALAGGAIAGAWGPWWIGQANVTAPAIPAKPVANPAGYGHCPMCPMATGQQPMAAPAAGMPAAGKPGAAGPMAAAGAAGWHGHHGAARGAWATASETTVTGTVTEIYEPRMLVIDTGSGTAMVVLPYMMKSPSGGLVSAETILAKIQPGTTVTVEGYAKTQPLTGYTIVHATAITVDGETYTWARGYLAQQIAAGS